MQNPSQTNADDLNNAKPGTSRNLRNKTREYQ